MPIVITHLHRHHSSPSSSLIPIIITHPHHHLPPPSPLIPSSLNPHHLSSWLTTLLLPQNFLALCASGYYDGSPVHRLIPEFMFQTGTPATPSPPENPKTGRSIWGGNFEDEIRPALRHNARGILSMANKGPGTNGSQFFVLFAPAPHLDGLNTVFGRVLMDDDATRTLAMIEAVEADTKNKPKVKITIDRVTMHANPLAG
jgi:peptidyl-prolyl cis-trans isomerase-like 3